MEPNVEFAESRGMVDLMPAALAREIACRMFLSPSRITKMRAGSRFDLQEMRVNLITLSGHTEENDDQFTLSWKH